MQFAGAGATVQLWPLGFARRSGGWPGCTPCCIDKEAQHVGSLSPWSPEWSAAAVWTCKSWAEQGHDVNTSCADMLLFATLFKPSRCHGTLKVNTRVGAPALVHLVLAVRSPILWERTHASACCFAKAGTGGAASWLCPLAHTCGSVLPERWK